MSNSWGACALAMALMAASAAVHAQPASAAAGGSAAAPSSPAKKALVARILKLQQPGIENMARQIAERPAAEMMQQAGQALKQVEADKREAIAKDIQADARKYADEAGAIAKSAAVKLAPSTIGTVLEANFSEAELKQLVAILESLDSPVNRKLQSLGPEMQKSLGEKLIAETRSSIEPKVKALNDSIARRLQPPAAPASGAKP
jgi:hypothetical protein